MDISSVFALILWYVESYHFEDSGVGVTKPISSIVLFSQFLWFIKILWSIDNHVHIYL